MVCYGKVWSLEENKSLVVYLENLNEMLKVAEYVGVRNIWSAMIEPDKSHFKAYCY